MYDIMFRAIWYQFKENQRSNPEGEIFGVSEWLSG